MMTSSERTKILQAKTIYLDKLIRDNAINNGIIGQINYNGISANDMYILDAAPYLYTPTELNNDLLINGLSIPALQQYSVTTPTLPEPAIGVTWTEQRGSGSRAWRSVTSSSDGNKLVGNINTSVLYISIDSGITWTVSSVPGITRIDTLAFSPDDTKLIVAGALSTSNVILISTDFGLNWTTLFNTISSNAFIKVAISPDFTKLTAITNFKVYVSIDSGVNWIERLSIINSFVTLNSGAIISANIGGDYITSASFSSDCSKLMFTLTNGDIYISADYGVTWTSRTISAGGFFRIACSSNGNKIVAARLGGLIYTSTDSGVTWTPQNSGSRNWSAITSSSNGNILVVTVRPGQIYASVDSGVTWTQKTTGTSKNWFSVSASSDCSKIVAAVSGGYIYTSP